MPVTWRSSRMPRRRTSSMRCWQRWHRRRHRMDGIHDLGGMNGFGPVAVEPDEPVFHEPWEAIAFALNALGIAVLGAYNVDEYRHAIE
ncbi:MAG: hypothetical protein ACRERC_08900, partial [Candidatus Binatia bacterium]